MRNLVAIAMLIISGCSGSHSVGDATLVDNGILAAQRYRLEFGSVDLAEEKERRYAIHGVPSTKFVFGFEVPLKKEYEGVSSKIEVDFEVRSGEEVVAKVNRTLDEWVANISLDKVFFWCCRGQAGPNSHFQIDSEKKYIIIIRTSSMNLNSSVPAEFVAEGGGWKA